MLTDNEGWDLRKNDLLYDLNSRKWTFSGKAPKQAMVFDEQKCHCSAQTTYSQFICKGDNYKKWKTKTYLTDYAVAAI